MKVLFISNDPTMFDSTSAVRMRLRAYAAVLGEVHAISVAPGHTNDVHEGALHLYPIQASRLLRIPALARRARVLIRERGIEVVSAQDPFEHGLIAWKAVLGTNARLHIQLHTDPFARDFANVGHPMSYINFVRLLIMSFVLRRAARIRVVSARLAREMRERYHPRAPITILPIYTDLARFRSVVRAREQGSLLWIGRFEKEKNPMLALAALAAVRSIGIDAHLTLLGAGRLELPLRLRAKELGVDTHVTFPGFVDPLPYLAKAELVLATSLYEGYGLAIVEALAAGVPVLSTDVGIAREVGALIPSGESYAAALSAWFAHGPREGHLTSYPYASFDDYVSAYAADIQATARLSTP